MENYQNTITLNANANTVYEALTKHIPQWWSELFEGTSDNEGATFTVRFGDNIYKTFEVTALEADAKVTWLVADSLIDLPQLTNKSEWIGTHITWEIKAQGNSTLLQLTHVGLTPVIECYEICQAGWSQFLASFKAFAETGNGMPFKVS